MKRLNHYFFDTDKVDVPSVILFYGVSALGIIVTLLSLYGHLNI